MSRGTQVISGRTGFKPWFLCALPAPLSLKARVESLAAGSHLDCWQTPLDYAGLEGDWALLDTKGNIPLVAGGVFGLSALAEPYNWAS